MQLLNIFRTQTDRFVDIEVIKDKGVGYIVQYKKNSGMILWNGRIDVTISASVSDIIHMENYGSFCRQF